MAVIFLTGFFSYSAPAGVQAIAAHVVTFNAQGGSSVPNQNWTEGTSLTLPDAPTRAGYTFNGWYDASSAGTRLGGGATARNGLDFGNGINNTISVPHNIAFNPLNITIEAWIKTSNTSEQYITCKTEDSFFLATNISGGAGKVNFYLKNAGGWLHSSTTVTDGAWHHVAATYNGTTMNIYVDGLLDRSWSVTSDIAGGGNAVNIGSRSGSYRFVGTMYDLRYWNIARSASQISSAKNSQLVGNETGLVAHYSFNQGIAGGSNSGVTSLTSSTGTQTGTLTGFSLSGSTSNWVAVPSLSSAYTPSNTAPFTVFAQWTAITNNAITYNTQSATTSHSGGSSTYVTGAAISTIPTTAPIKTGSTFLGWFTASSGGTLVTDGSYIPPTPYGAITLYAQWVSNTVPSNSVAPSISGTVQVGQVVTATTGTWTGTPTPTYSYQWKSATTVDGSYTNLSGASTASSYTLASAHVGLFIKVEITGTNSVSSVAALSAATSSATAAPSNSVAPSISGTVQVGQVLTAARGTWTGTPTPTYTYQWKSASSVSGSYSNIAGETSSSYTVTSSDVGKFFKIAVTATNSVDDVTVLSSATSSATAAPSNSVAPSISGTVQVGQVLTAARGTWTGTPTPTYTYQWKSASSVSGSYSNIAGETSSSYTVTSSDVGKFFKIAVTATNSVDDVTVLSSATSSATAVATTTTTSIASVVEIVVNAPTTTSDPPTTIDVGQSAISTIAAPVATFPSVTSLPGVVVAATSTTIVRTALSPATPKTTSTTLPKNAGVTVSRLAPVIQSVASGEVGVKVGNKSETATVKRVNNQYVVSAGALTATFGAINSNGESVPLDVKGNVRLAAEDKIKITMNGFKPDSTVEAWLFSTPVLMGTTQVGPMGSVTGTFTIPKNVASGAHRIALVAELDDGKPTTFTIGVMVGEPGKGVNITLWLIVLPLALAVVGALVLPATRRKRRRAA